MYLDRGWKSTGIPIDINKPKRASQPKRLDDFMRNHACTVTHLQHRPSRVLHTQHILNYHLSKNVFTNRPKILFIAFIAVVAILYHFYDISAGGFKWKVRVAFGMLLKSFVVVLKSKKCVESKKCSENSFSLPRFLSLARYLSLSDCFT